MYTRITPAEFEAQLKQEITAADNTLDVSYDEILDTAVRPQAAVLSRVFDRLVNASQVLGLQDPTNFDVAQQALFQAMLRREGLALLPGSPATGEVYFYRTSAPGADYVIPRGFPVMTDPDPRTGAFVTYVTTVERVMVAASASVYYSATRNDWGITVPVVAVQVGRAGQVGANQVRRLGRALYSFQVTNLTPMNPASAPETLSQALSRLLLAVQGRNASGPVGFERELRAMAPQISDLRVLYGDALSTARRTASPTAVDAVLLTGAATRATEYMTYLGLGQLHVLSRSPVVSVTAVRHTTAGTDYVVDGAAPDVETVLDTGPNKGSARAQDGVVFRTTGPNSALLPAVGETVTVEYTYDSVVRQAQTDLALPENFVFGRDALVRRAFARGVVVEARMRLYSSAPESLRGTVEQAIIEFVGGRGLAAEQIDPSDIVGVARRFSGVDDFVLTRLSYLEVPSGVSTLTFAVDEYPVLDPVNLVIELA